VSADEKAVFAHCRTTTGLISDGAARTIASWWVCGLLGQSFVSTGAVPEGVWEELVDGGAVLTKASPEHAVALQMLHAYLTHHAGRGPVAGWSGVWVR
jgi:hypothetical protein